MIPLITLPRSTLNLIPSALHRGIFLSMLEKADEQGALSISVRKFAEEIGVSYQTLRTAIEKLASNAIINAIATQRITQITICNYDSYTASSRKQQRKVNATDNATTNQSKTTKFSPPSEKELTEYVASKNYHFNPIQFISFYQSKGWKVGREAMKDWKAACVTWEQKWKEKYGEQYHYQLRCGEKPSGRGQHRNPTALSLAKRILGDDAD